MTEKLKFTVLRPHEGDRMYQPGDIREGTMAELQHLVPNTLHPLGRAKSEARPLNKMEKPPGANKIDYGAKTVPELREIAASRKLDLGDAIKKGDIIAALELSDEAAQ